MKKGWEYKKLGEVCDQLNGLWKGKKEPFINVGVIRNANFTKDFTLNTSNIEYLDVEERSYSKRKLYPGDLIVEKSGGSEKQPVGRAILFDIAEGEYSFSNFTSVLRIKDRSFISPNYLYKFLLHSYKRGDTFTMQNAATGIHNIIWESYLGIKVPVPPLAEQEEIVRYLDAAFAKIDELKMIAEQQLTESKALFQKALSEYLSPKKGWEYRPFTACLAKIKKQKQVKAKDYQESGMYPIVSQEAELISGYSDDNSLLFHHDKPIVIFGDHTKIVKYVDFDFVVGADGTQLLCPKDDIDSKFFYYVLRSVKLRELGYARHFKLLKETSIPVPPLAEQQAIVEKLDAISERCRQLEENYKNTIALCDDLKQKILKQVFE